MLNEDELRIRNKQRVKRTDLHNTKTLASRTPVVGRILSKSKPVKTESNRDVWL